jgi:sterol desaturase/sphingolipid hydroxylase (fatty acid hydroxylase superfamily)
MNYLNEFFYSFTFNFLATFIFYIFIATPFFMIFWVYCREKYKNWRIQPKKRSTPQIIRYEIKYSIISIFIFTIVNASIYVASLKGYTQIYYHIREYGWPYFFLSFVLMMIIHDAWFYFTHVFMHHPKVFKHVHLVHHQSKDPSPYSSFSFHPIEAFIQAGILIVISFIMPVNVIALTIWQLVQLVLNVMGHCGYEVYPRFITNNKFFAWKTAATHHNMHHSKFNGNYALYFTWWDKLFKTEFKDYHSNLEKVQERKRAAKDNINTEIEQMPSAKLIIDKP